jgi:hypothetical protein
VTLALEFVGAAAILLAFVLLQAGRLNPRASLYLGLNLVGSAILTVIALAEQQWGFVILQAVWSLVAAGGILQRLRGGESEDPYRHE